MDRDQEIPFVYEGGMLRPEGPVDLPEGAHGIARIREVTQRGANPPGIDGRAAMKEVRRISDSRAFDSAGTRLNRDQMHERD